MNEDRGVLISANWKMNENHYEAVKLVTELSALLRTAPLPERREVSLHPSFTSLRTVQTLVETDRIPVALGAQNCHFEDAGAFTGEVSASMLAKLGVAYVLCGHSERRAFAHETSEEIGKKIDAVMRHNMSPILCVGESVEARSAGDAEGVVGDQLAAVVTGLRRAAISRFVVAYEPIWAIGTGVTPSVEEAAAMCAYIHHRLEELAGAQAASVRVQYGGSVSAENAAALLAQPSIDGLLVGGASLDAAQFVAIARAGI
jgi:triosephosphate isomerase (TIM)